MNFVNPWALWLGLAAAPLIVAYLIRRFRRERRVSSLVIYRHLAGQMATRRRFATPQHLISLLLVLLALAALLLAVAEPQGEPIEPRRYIVVLDTTASMGITETGQTNSRLERAREQIAVFVELLNENDEVALISAGPEASLQLGWTHDHSRLVTAASDLEAVGRASGSLDALMIADALCQDVATTEIVLVSDGRGIAIPTLTCPLRFARIGAPADNVAITSLTVREADALGLVEVYYALYNAADRDQELLIELSIDGQAIGIESEVVAAGRTVERLLSLPLPNAGRILSARLVDNADDSLPDDDVAYAVLQPGARVSALLVTEHPTTFLVEALRLHPRIDLSVVGPSELSTTTASYDLVVVDSEFEGQLPSADHLVLLDVAYPYMALQTTGQIVQPRVIRWSFDHPLFRFVNLDGVHIASSSAIRLPDDAVSLMDMPDGPLAFLTHRNGREILFLTFHPDRSDLPLRVAFVNFVANLVEWAQDVDPGSVASGVGPGQRVTNDSTMTLTTLASDVTDGNAVGSFSADQPIPSAGVFELQTETGVSRALVTANLFSAEEATLTPRNRLGVGAMGGWPQSTHSEAFPWWILVVAALTLMALEWLLPLLIGLSHRATLRRENRSRGSGASSRYSQQSQTASVAGAEPG